MKFRSLTKISISISVIFSLLILIFQMNIYAMDFKAANNHPFMVTWNKGKKNFSYFMNGREGCRMSFALENTYFGTPENQISQAKLLAFGKCVAKAMHRFLK